MKMVADERSAEVPRMMRSKVCILCTFLKNSESEKMLVSINRDRFGAIAV